jgi:ectoine hydrolase
MLQALNKIAPGVPQYEIIGDIYKNQINGVDGKYGDYTGLCPLIQVGESTSTPHLTCGQMNLCQKKVLLCLKLELLDVTIMLL